MTFEIAETSRNNSPASATVISKRSATLFPLYSTSKTFCSNRFPRHVSHGIYTSLRNCMSSRINPAPLHAVHLPASTLKENDEAESLLSLASEVSDRSFRTVVQISL